MSNFSKILIGLSLFVAFSLRMEAALHDTSIPSHDAAEYDSLAMSLVKGEGYRNEQGELTAFRPPLYPFFLASIYSVAGHDYRAVRVIQAILSTITVFLIVLLAYKLFGNWSACFAGIIAALYPSFYAYYYGVSHLITETLYTFLLTAALVFLYLYLIHFSKSKAVISGLFLGLAILTRPIVLPILFILPIALVVAGYPLRRVIKYHLFVWFVAGLVLMPWTVRNYLVFDSIVPVATMGGTQFYSSNHPESDGFGDNLLHNSIYPEDRKLSLSGVTEPARSQYFYKKGLNYIVSNPGKAFKLFQRKVFLYMDPITTLYNTDKQKKIINWPYLSVLIGFMVGSVIVLFDKSNRPPVLSLVFIFGYFLVIHSMWHPCERYRFPTEPILIVVTSFFLSCLAQYLPIKSRK